MRFLSFTTAGPAPQCGYGLIDPTGDGVVELGSRIEGAPDLGQLVGQQRLGEAAKFSAAEPDHRLADLVYERLLPWPQKIFCIGVNYGGRSAEYDDKSDAAWPSVFVRFADSFTGHDRPLLRPPESHQLDYEGEIVVVIGKPGRRIPMHAARDHIAGLTLGNEGTIRDWVRHAKFNVTQGKNWLGSGSFGPHLVTMDEVGDLDDLSITTTVNGQVRQSDNTSSMKYSIAYQVHYLSTFTLLRPGDVIFTGTPTGAGARHDPPIWLEPGDEIQVSVPGLGTLRNTVTDEFSYDPGHRTPEPQ